jgi:hypothetical protein
VGGSAEAHEPGVLMHEPGVLMHGPCMPPTNLADDVQDHGLELISTVRSLRGTSTHASEQGAHHERHRRHGDTPDDLPLARPLPKRPTTPRLSLSEEVDARKASDTPRMGCGSGMRV